LGPDKVRGRKDRALGGDGGGFRDLEISDALEQNYMPYVMSVIMSRALPSIDGFKPSHRKLLYTMYRMGLLNGARTKSANIVGQTMRLNPHGDLPIYDTMVRLTEGNASLLHPFIDSKGNFGKQYSRDMQSAAARYTEARLSPICEEVFRDIEKGNVDFIPNYDNTMTEPTLLPVTFPSVLVSNNQGIAVGMASNICGFNLREVCEATIAYIGGDEEGCVDRLLGPDFPNGGTLILSKEEMDAIYRTGKGGFKVRANYAVDEAGGYIEITEIPYTTTIEAVIEEIVQLAKDGKLRDVNDVRDETDLRGLKITLDIKKSADAEALMNRLFKVTSLQDTFSCNFNILVDGAPRVMGVREILGHWLIFRIGCVMRQTAHDLAKAEERLHLLNGLAAVMLDIDKAIAIIRGTEEERQVVPNLMDGFGIDEAQAEYVCDIRLRNLNKRHLLDRVKEVSSLKASMADMRETLGSEPKVRKMIAGELAGVAKRHGKDRRTAIAMEGEVVEASGMELVDDYNVRVFLSEHGYFKKIPLAALRVSPQQKTKEDDAIVQEADCRNRDDALLFTDRCTVYKMRLYELADFKAGMLGEYLPNHLGLEPGEVIVGMIVTGDYSGHALFAFENGKVAKVELSSYATKTNRKRLSGAYGGESRLVWMAHLRDDMELAMFSDNGKTLLFGTGDVNAKASRASVGVQVMKLRSGSRVSRVRAFEEGMFGNPDYYRTKNVPAMGVFLRKEDEQRLSGEGARTLLDE